MSRSPEEQAADLAVTCAYACASGAATVTLSVRGIRPPGFPRGELLSIGADGSKNYAVDPVKVLAWVRAVAARSTTAPGGA